MALRLLVIAGPTASGKTRLAVDAAHRLGSEIVSADSRQVYRGLDIGSGKDRDEYRRVSPPIRHHMIDIADPCTIYSLFHYQRDCYRILEAAANRPRFRDGVPLLLVGGTGLYIEAVLRRFRIPNVPEDVTLRKRLMERPADELSEQLRRIDPELSQRTDLSSKKRVVRALEVAAASTRRPIHHSEPPKVDFETRVFCMAVERDLLHQRIDLRLDSRLRQGLVAEVEELLASGVPEARMAQLGLEYREVTAFLTGRKSESEMIADLRRGIRRFAKRQQTWFRGLPRRGIPVRWIDAESPCALLQNDWRDRPGS